MKKFSAMAMPSKDKAPKSEDMGLDLFGEESEETPEHEGEESAEFEAGEEEEMGELAAISDDKILEEAKKRGLI